MQRFKRMVLPEDIVEISVEIKEVLGQFYNLSGEIKNRNKTALTISFALALVKIQTSQYELPWYGRKDFPYCRGSKQKKRCLVSCKDT